MNKIIQTLSTSVVIFALVFSGFNAPMVSVANAQTTAGFSLDLPGFDLPDLGDFFDGVTSGGSTQIVMQTCKLEATQLRIPAGGSTTLNWETSGFDVFKLNGQTLSGSNGTLQMTNLLQNTTYELIAETADGLSDCVSRLTIVCIPPTPVDCRLEVLKTVDKSTASVGDTLTYNITVKNIGTTDCTGSGVKIEDVINDNLNYLTSSVSSNFRLGYEGVPVYTMADRTLHFNGNILSPNESGTITWTGTVKTPTLCGDFEVPNQAKATALELNNFGTWAYSQTVRTAINNDCQENPAPSCDLFTATPANITVGQSAVLAWQTSNATQVTMNNGIGNVAADGSVTVSPTVNTIYQLTVAGTQGRSVNCSKTVTVSADPAPSCDSFVGTPATIMVGQTASLAWQTSNASRVVINNGVGEVALDGSTTVSPLNTTTYTLTAFGTQNRSVNCIVLVNTTTNTVPQCELFTVTPSTLPSTGGQVTLNWKVNGATNVSIAPTIGTVSSQASQVTNVTANTNFVLTATDAEGDKVTCAAPVTLADAPVLSCANNVSFTASDYSIKEGEDTTLSWSTTNLDSVSISGINSTAFAGSSSVDPSTDITYILTARKGTQSVDCPLRIEVDEDGGGGGGGSSSPKCELSLSDNKIKRGEQITLKWDTTRATEVTIKDDKGKTIMSTDKYSSKDKDEYYDGSLKLKPTRDTEYTLVAKKGSKDRTCKVKVDVDDLTVLTDRDQKPLVAGISLSNVPYTGFEAGAMLTIMFYTLLAAWALFVTYLIVARPRVAVGVIGGAKSGIDSMKQAEAIRPDVFVPAVVASVAVAVPTAVTIPANLPTGTPVIGYDNAPVSFDSNPHHVSDDVVTALENRAHTQRALLSSDAIRHFIATTEGMVERNEALDQVISDAKGHYPLEDGWIVINEARMRGLCETCIVNQTEGAASFVPVVVPDGSSSLAEAIVTGNIVAAYEMIGNRPMFALADAASDLDAVVRGRRGENTSISTLLSEETVKLSDEKIKNMIAALTGALDGTYTDEASAVKMAIMKAVKEVA
jgi:uncharacterized repeat protein (TIGR01451 family)